MKIPILFNRFINPSTFTNAAAPVFLPIDLFANGDRFSWHFNALRMATIKWQKIDL